MTALPISEILVKRKDSTARLSNWLDLVGFGGAEVLLAWNRTAKSGIRRDDENGLELTPLPMDYNERRRIQEGRQVIRRHTRNVDDHAPYEADIQLQRANTKGKMIKEIRGNIPIEVVVARKNIVIDNFLKSKGTKVRVGTDSLDGSDSLEIAEVTWNEKESSSYVLIVGTGWTRGWADRVHLEDAHGNRYRQTFTNYNASSFQYRYKKPDVPDVGPAVKLIIEDWTIVDHSIPFVFKDVPLP